MNYIKGYDREQAVLFPKTIDSIIEKNNTIRFIDAFVNSLQIIEMGFRDIRQNKNGRPPFRPKDLLKLYIYMVTLIRSVHPGVWKESVNEI